MSANILPVWAVNQYSTNIKLLSQQLENRLAKTVERGTHVGKQASPVDQIGAIVAQKVTERFAPMPRIDAPLDRRWVFPQPYEVPQLIDTFDMLQILTDPKSQLTRNAVAAMVRAQDDEIIGSFFSTSFTGQNGTVQTAFPAGQVVGANTGGAASGLNFNKIRAGKKILLQNEALMPGDQIYCVVNGAKHDDLLNEVQIIDSDYAKQLGVVMSADGMLQRALGVEFVHSERILQGVDDQAGTSYAVPMYTKSGMYLGTWNDIETSVDPRPDLTDRPWQILTKMMVGGARLEEKRVVQIWAR